MAENKVCLIHVLLQEVNICKTDEDLADRQHGEKQLLFLGTRSALVVS